MLNKVMIKFASKQYVKKVKVEILDSFKPCSKCKDAYNEHKKKSVESFQEFFDKLLKRRE